MNNVLKYKGYVARIEYDIEEKILFGKIEGIADLITFESTNSTEIENEFHSAVDDYLTYCKEIGKDPNKPFKGVFNVRIDHELHRIAAMQAMRTGRTLNSFVEDAIKTYITDEAPSVVINNYEVINTFNSRTADYMNSRQSSWDEMSAQSRRLDCAKLN